MNLNNTDPVLRWVNRRERALELAVSHPSARELLQFYAVVLEFQAEVAVGTVQEVDPRIGIRDQIDYSLPLSCFPRLLRDTIESAPAPLRQAAMRLQQQDKSALRQVLQDPSEGPEFDWFFSRASLQPIAERLQTQLPESTDHSARLCPACGSLPQLVILRPEGEGARRFLQCSFCLREWTFRRLLCPYCAETNKEKLPYYTAEECKYVRVEACDTCRHYLKSVDLSIDGLAQPLVDEVALAALDVWAVEHGYTKIAKNLTGI